MQRYFINEIYIRLMNTLCHNGTTAATIPGHPKWQGSNFEMEKF